MVWMDDEEEDELKMAIRLSMQESAPEPKRSKQLDMEESTEDTNRRSQRELMAAAAEKRFACTRSIVALGSKAEEDARVSIEETHEKTMELDTAKDVDFGEEISMDEADKLFSMMFGSEVTKDILAQWNNQGIRFSDQVETSIGLVQREAGPCGVLAAIQAFVLKHLLFSGKGIDKFPSSSSAPTRTSDNRYPQTLDPASFGADERLRALVESLCEILFLAGNSKCASIVTVSAVEREGDVENPNFEETITSVLEGVSLDSAFNLQKFLRFKRYYSTSAALQRIGGMVHVFQSRLGAMLFLISALMSRSLDLVQADRDDPSQPLVTAPFGHASQEIVNLLLYGQAVANVFDGSMDLGDGMFLKGISSGVQVGFLTLLESLNLCKVGTHLKRPDYPIWVVGSESHYTLLFSADPSVQDEAEPDSRERLLRHAFDSLDRSGGGGFIPADALGRLLDGSAVRLPPDDLAALSAMGFVVWSDFRAAVLRLDEASGGLARRASDPRAKSFELYHFNGIATSAPDGGGVRPRLTTVRVSVPPKWTPEEYDRPDESRTAGTEHQPQHSPLVDCIRTRWPRAACSWDGHPPSIV